jgi:hypothetical protein
MSIYTYLLPVQKIKAMSDREAIDVADRLRVKDLEYTR